MRNQNCRQCKWWTQKRISWFPKEGECRAERPIVVGHNVRMVILWPITKEDDFCGEFEREKEDKNG